MRHSRNLSYFCRYDEEHAMGILPEPYFWDDIPKFFSNATLCFVWKDGANE
jgi:hypothetical protein